MMKNNKLILIFLFVLLYSCTQLFAQESTDTTSIKYLINKGQEAYSSGDYSLSNDFYEKALLIDRDNYDARYAIAENYYKLKQYEKSLEKYQILLDKNNENTDVLNGMARSYTRLESYDKAMAFLKRSLSVNDRDPSVYSDLAFLYIVNDKLDSAKYAYQEVLKIDSTNAEAWAGIGKMYYWQDKPASAIKYYKKALLLDPENPEIKTKYENVKRELAFSVKATLMYLTEEEPSSIKDKPAYKISAFVQKYGVEKRITDHFSIAAFTLWDYSQRDNLYLDDVRRWYDNTVINPVFLLKSHRISVFAGASVNDSRSQPMARHGVLLIISRSLRSGITSRRLTIIFITGTRSVIIIYKTPCSFLTGASSWEEHTDTARSETMMFSSHRSVTRLKKEITPIRDIT